MNLNQFNTSRTNYKKNNIIYSFSRNSLSRPGSFGGEFIQNPFKLLSVVLLAAELAMLVCLIIHFCIVGFIPVKYIVAVIIGSAVILGGQAFAFIKADSIAWLDYINIGVSAVVIVISILGFSITNTVDNITFEVAKNDTLMQIYVRNESSYQQITDLYGKTMGYFSIDEKNESAFDDINKQVAVEYVAYDSMDAMLEGLKNSEIESALINVAFLDIYLDEHEEFEEWARLLTGVEVELASNSNAVEADVVKEPFVVYLSGLDTRGSTNIRDTGRSDVNMITVVNPVTKKVLIINVPRDFYVSLYGDDNKKDKLTHAGIHGIECSMQALENLFDIEFNYYVKVNFTSVVEIVDAMGGVTVDSDFAFTATHSYSGKTYKFVKGENKLSGDSAVGFARERYCFSEGDRQRGKNQQKVIAAILDKATSPAILSIDINNVLEAVTTNTKSNFSKDNINAIIQMQLSDMASWDIQTISVNGTDDYQKTYSSPRKAVYVMQPDMDTIKEAQEQIALVMGTSTSAVTSEDETAE